MMILNYQDFKAQYKWVPVPGLYVGELLDTSNVVSFSAQTLQELKQLMIEAVEELKAKIEIAS